MNTDTPETDLFLDSLKGTFLFNGTMSQYMRKLERERDQARQERDELAMTGHELASYANESLPKNQPDFLEGLFERVQAFANAYEKTYGTLEKLKEPKSEGV